MTKDKILLDKLTEDIRLIQSWFSQMMIDEIWVRKESKYDQPTTEMVMVPDCNLEIVLSTLSTIEKYIDHQKKNPPKPAPDVAGLVEALMLFFANEGISTPSLVAAPQSFNIKTQSLKKLYSALAAHKPEVE